MSMRMSMGLSMGMGMAMGMRTGMIMRMRMRMSVSVHIQISLCMGMAMIMHMSMRMRVRVNGQRACVRLPAEVNKRAVQILDHHKTAYGAFNVLEDQDVREGVKAYSCVPLPACTHARTRAHTHTHAQRAVGGLLICTPPRPVRHSCVAASSTPVLANLAGCDGLDHDCLT